jgi:hypothetical protein
MVRFPDFMPLLRWRSPARVDAGGLVGGEGAREAETVGRPAFRSAALARFLEAVGSRQAATLVDLGPVIGANVAFLGERIGCKIYVEDLYADLDRHVQHDTLDRFPDFLEARFPLPAESVDGVLCWEVFDYLQAPAGAVLARELTRMLRPGGVLLALFGTVAPRETAYTKYVIEDAEHLRSRDAAAAGGRRRVLQNRDIVKLFERLEVSASVLLKCRLREMLFRKPPTSA